ncbi:4-alpha-glucanotransferase [Acidihalobacter aeolianus]|uniref:4-alpha-glucanotransferase n=1 Tax=Acidihalobacter aeolianus TaxID=2792603 RepID=UPI000ACD40AD|nr:4-alpha-glucanotransferase [Acidihalobacter aeolianus]
MRDKAALQQSKSVLDRRTAGILLHPTSLPGPYSTGIFGEDAYRFVDLLSAAGIGVWQLLPLNEPHGEGSPYQCQSAHAGDTRLIDPAWVAEEYGVELDPFDMDQLLDLALSKIHVSPGREEEFHAFLSQHAYWLDDYALYRTLRLLYQNRPWWEWPDEYRDRHKDALEELQEKQYIEINRCRFSQFVFFCQWKNLRDYANRNGVSLFGDMPIFVAHDSADVWVNRELFDLDERGFARSRSGVPPDYFSATGQLWGNPLYRWDKMLEDDFAWWLRRFETQLELYDFIRVDHFRGFVACWSVPMGEDTAMNGHWVDVPGRELFEKLFAHFGYIPIVAEDLGVITPDVETLRDDFDLPGMRILQFAFDSDADNPYLPHNFIQNCVVYTGTHDNDTTLGWFEGRTLDARKRILDYLGNPGEPMPAALIRTAMASVASLAVVPMQDLLGLGSEHRMNTPGTSAEVNWRWRFTWEMCAETLVEDLRSLCETYGRLRKAAL